MLSDDDDDEAAVAAAAAVDDDDDDDDDAGEEAADDAVEEDDGRRPVIAGARRDTMLTPRLSWSLSTTPPWPVDADVSIGGLDSRAVTCRHTHTKVMDQ